MKNPYLSIEAEIGQIIEETPNIKTFVLKPRGKFSFSTGQFIELAIPGVGEAPFTPSSSPEDTSQIEVTIMRVGFLTEKIHHLKEGEKAPEGSRVVRLPNGKRVAILKPKKGLSARGFHNKEHPEKGGYHPMRKTKRLRRWIQRVKIKKGTLHSAVGVPKDRTIPKSLIKKIYRAKIGTIVKNPTKTGKRSIKVTRKLKQKVIYAVNVNKKYYGM